MHEHALAVNVALSQGGKYGTVASGKCVQFSRERSCIVGDRNGFSMFHVCKEELKNFVVHDCFGTVWVAELQHLPLSSSDRDIILNTNSERPTLRYTF